MANNPALELMDEKPSPCQNKRQNNSSQNDAGLLHRATPEAPVTTATSDPDGYGHAVTDEEPKTKHENLFELHYRIDQSPPWYLSIFLGFQHYLTMFGATVAIPLILAEPLCIGQDYVALSEIIGTIFFVSGLSTLVQTTFGSRLPIVQGCSSSFLIPTFAILNLHGECPAVVTANNITGMTDIHANVASDEWKLRMREIQGAILMASLFQVAIGMTGLVGLMLQYIGPLTIAPTITLIGLSLFKVSADFCSHQWWIAIMTIVLIAIFSQYMRDIEIPCCGWGTRNGKKRWHAQRVPIFKLFPIILSIIIAWIICAILTNVKNHGEDILPTDGWGQKARTDVRSRVLYEAAWFRFPYPFQWGLPKFTLAGTFGMLAGVLAGIMESIGDYYACARLSGAPPPPTSALNRGVLAEGIACILAGMWGTGNGSTSYSGNIGAIGITKVGSRRVIQTSACIMILFAMFGKFGALFVTIPEPIIGGLFMTMFGMISAVGISSLQYVDLNSTRNLFILGFALFFGLSMPQWVSSHPGSIETGVVEVDQIITVLLSTSMFVGGAVGFVLDLTIPGTDEERGITKWRQQMTDGDGEVSQGTASIHTYDFPFGMNIIRNIKFLQYIPICPTFAMGSKCGKKDKSGDNKILAGVITHPTDTDNGVLYHGKTETDSTHF